MAEWAAEHHAVASLAELAALGLDRSAVSRRVAAGRLHRVHAGVYAIGHRLLSAHGRWRAAVLACGPGAVLSHQSAAALWGIRPSARRLIDVTTPARGRVGHEGIDLHRVRRLDPADVTERDGIAVTTVARTLVDLAELLRPDALAKAVHEVDVLRLLDARAIADAVARANGRRRATRLLTLVDEPTAPTRSELERRFLALCRRAGLPRPEVNVRVETPGGTYEVDVLWRAQRLAVETDGTATHHTRRAFEADRRRDVDLALAGLTVVRYTWQRVTEEETTVATELTELLALRAA